MNSNSTRNPSGKVAFLGVMTAAALMLSYIESLFILVPGIPGIKLGFANLAVVLCLYRYGWKEALFLNAVRIALAAFLFGSMFTMLYSLAGAACAFAAMVLAKRLKLFSVVGVSVLGGVCHNLGQLAVAVAVLGGSWAGWYLPWLMLAGCVTGIFIGVCAGAEHMIAYLNGILAEIEEENIVIEVNGIGYNVRIPAGMAGRLPQIGEVVKLYTYTSVREDAIGLYGFLSRDDLNMYRQLITVSGIGPKGGLSVLSAMSADELRMAVISQDAKAIAKAPGVGTKTAQRIILELKDKISLEDTAMMREVNQVPQGSMLTGKSQAQTEAVEALTALGYSPSEALRAVKAVLQETPDLDVEALLKAALKKMF